MNRKESIIQRVANRFGFRFIPTHKQKRSVIKEFLKINLMRVGYEIEYVREVEPNPKYEAIDTYATYSPWNIEADFVEAFDKIQDFTLVDKYRCFEIWKLVEQVSKLEKGAILEVGVWKGGTGALMAKCADLSSIKEKIYLCDTFQGVVKTTANDSAYADGEHSDASREGVERLVRDGFGLSNVEILEGIFPEETGQLVENQLFRLCHIDVDVYQSSKDTVDWIWDRMVPNGVIVFDDYGYVRTDGITKHIEEMMMDKDKYVFYNLNGHAVIVKI